LRDLYFIIRENLTLEFLLLGQMNKISTFMTLAIWELALIIIL